MFGKQGGYLVVDCVRPSEVWHDCEDGRLAVLVAVELQGIPEPREAVEVVVLPGVRFASVFPQAQLAGRVSLESVEKSESKWRFMRR